VAEVILSLDPDTQGTTLPYKTGVQPDPDNEYSFVTGPLWVRTLEDPLRVRFPVFDSGSRIPTRGISEIKDKEELDGHAVYKVLLHGDETLYVYKEVERPHYVPPDTEALEQELQNLELFRGTKANIVHLVAAVISQNPYQTTQTSNGKDSNPNTLRGILLEYHPRGTLETILESPNPEVDPRWCQWACQIASALAEMHQRGLTHMDLKPSNVVISNDFDAVLIDISGIGGVTRKRLSLEMLGENDPLSLGFEARKQNDIWAFGRILLAMADACRADDEKPLLRSIAQAAATRACPRIPLHGAVAALLGCHPPITQGPS